MNQELVQTGTPEPVGEWVNQRRGPLLTGLLKLLAGTPPGGQGSPHPGLMDLVPGLAVLMGPAKYAMQRSSPNLARYLDRVPARVYAGFGELQSSSSKIPGMRTAGTTSIMGPERAAQVNTLHEVLGGLRLPTPQTAASTSFARGTNPPPYSRLSQRLQPGDIEIRLSPEFDPTRRAADLPRRFVSEPLLPGKSRSDLFQQAEAAIHEGLHAAWASKLPESDRLRIVDLADKLKSGSLAEPERKELRGLMSKMDFPDNPALFDVRGRSTLDLEDSIRELMGELTPGHAALTGIARDMARRRNRVGLGKLVPPAVGGSTMNRDLSAGQGG